MADTKLAERRGRKTILTAKRRQAIVASLRNGASFKAACEAAGVAERVGYIWREKGREGVKPCYAQFDQEVTRAVGDFENRMCEIISIAAPDDWRAGAFMLERRFPHTWGKKTVNVQSTVNNVNVAATIGVGEGRAIVANLTAAGVELPEHVVQQLTGETQDEAS